MIIDQSAMCYIYQWIRLDKQMESFFELFFELLARLGLCSSYEGLMKMQVRMHHIYILFGIIYNRIKFFDLRLAKC